MVFGSIIEFIELLQLVTTSKDYALTVLHTSQITIEHNRSGVTRFVMFTLSFVCSKSMKIIN
jgi:hypothetical protein